MLESPLTSSEIDSFVALSFRVFLWRRHAVVLALLLLFLAFVLQRYAMRRQLMDPQAFFVDHLIADGASL